MKGLMARLEDSGNVRDVCECLESIPLSLFAAETIADLRFFEIAFGQNDQVFNPPQLRSRFKSVYPTINTRFFKFFIGSPTILAYRLIIAITFPLHRPAARLVVIVTPTPYVSSIMHRATFFFCFLSFYVLPSNCFYLRFELIWIPAPLFRNTLSDAV